MKHEVDLSNYNLHTDLTIESIENNSIDNIDIKEFNFDKIKVTEVNIDEENSKIIGKDKGKYITIEFDDVTDTDNYNNVVKVFIKELSKFIKLKNNNDKILIIGLGNEKSTPDALGPLVINGITVTNHLYELGLLSKNYPRVCAITPSVMGKTGLETSDIIESIVSKINPTLVIVIDSLASTSIDRLNKTIQITDSGISPGSGIGNRRKDISIKTLHVPVIAIGIPTVVDAITIVSDTIIYLTKHYIYTKKNVNLPKYKLITKHNYLKENINKEDKELLLGLIGKLSNEELRVLLDDVLTPLGYNLIVTPKEIDYLIDCLSKVLYTGINDTLNRNVNIKK